MIPVFVISLARSTERARAMKRHLADLSVPFAFLEAVDGNRLSAEAIAALGVRPYYARRRSLSLSEIGCAASHLAICRRIHDEGHAFACVLEDDARVRPQALPMLDEAWLESVPPFDLLNLQGFKGHLALPVGRVGGTSILAPLRSRNGCVAHIVSRAGAEKIARAKIELDSPIDHYLYLSGRIPGLRLLNVRPRVVHWDRGPSTIGKQRAAARLPFSVATEASRVSDMIGRHSRQFGSFVSAWGPSALLNIRFLQNEARRRAADDPHVPATR